MMHEKLVAAATAAIDQVVSDTRVPASTTRASLRELHEHITMLLLCLRENCEEDEE